MDPFERNHPHERSGENPGASHSEGSGQRPGGPGRRDPRDPAVQLRAMQARREAERTRAGADPNTAPIPLAAVGSSTPKPPNRTKLWRGLAGRRRRRGGEGGPTGTSPAGPGAATSGEGATAPGATSKAPAAGGPAAGNKTGGPASATCVPGTGKAKGGPKGGPKGEALKDRPAPSAP